MHNQVQCVLMTTRENTHFIQQCSVMLLYTETLCIIFNKSRLRLAQNVGTAFNIPGMYLVIERLKCALLQEDLYSHP